MRLAYVPLLRIQRELYDIPRGLGRFQQYLRTMLTDDGSDIELLPLVAVSPMGREYLNTLLDEYLAFDADAIGAHVTVGNDPAPARLRPRAALDALPGPRLPANRHLR